jgi:hypothetical protein
MRGTGQEQGWVAAVTQRYKLVYSTRDEPWLFDLQEDPDELVNCFTDQRYRDTVRTLSRQLRDYGQTWKDPRVANARIQADLQWAIEGTQASYPATTTIRHRPSRRAARKSCRRKHRHAAGSVHPRDTATRLSTSLKYRSVLLARGALGPLREHNDRWPLNFSPVPNSLYVPGGICGQDQR